MKNRKGQTIPQPYLDLAMMRRDQQKGSEFRNKLDAKFENNGRLDYAFYWDAYPEDFDWWHEVYIGKTPDIPASSLAELEAWRKAKLIDYKTMYEDLLDKLEFYKKAFEGLKTTVEQNLHTAELQTTERNYVWEAALAAMQGFIASYAGAAKNPDIDTVAGISLTYAESLVAEGKKRNHI